MTVSQHWRALCMCRLPCSWKAAGPGGELMQEMGAQSLRSHRFNVFPRFRHFPFPGCFKAVSVKGYLLTGTLMRRCSGPSVPGRRRLLRLSPANGAFPRCTSRSLLVWLHWALCSRWLSEDGHSSRPASSLLEV